MSHRSDENLKGIPMKPYDLLREGLIVFSILMVLIIVLAAILGSPDYPTVRGEDVAIRQPLAFLETSANILAGNSSLEDYGPPYSNDAANAQRILGIIPATWFGVTIPIDPAQDLVLQPLERLAVVNTDLASALQTYQNATIDQQHVWLANYLAGLQKATLVNDQVQVPSGEYGPVAPLMKGMLDLGRSGLLEGALESSPQLPYTLNFTRSLLFFQDDVDHSVAATLDMLGGQWGISNETGPYPGAWWLWPYTFFYQVPPMSVSPNGDLQVAVIITILFLITVFTPFIPIINRLPRWLGVYKLIWRDWYHQGGNSEKS